MDETKEQQDSLQKETAPAGDGGTTPPETYDKAQVEKIIQEDRIARGRDFATLEQQRKTLEAQQQEVQQGLQRISEWERQRDAAEFEAAKGDPIKLDVYNRTKAVKDHAELLKTREAKLKEQEAELQRRDAELKAKEEAAAKQQFSDIVFEVSASSGVHPEAIRKKAEELKLTTKEQIAAVAIGLKDSSSFEPDTLIGKGTRKDLKSMTADQKLQEGFMQKTKKR